MIFNLASVLYWKVITSGKHKQVDIDNFQENVRQVMHDYAVDDLVYAEIPVIYHKIYYKKQGLYRIT